jgi:hypothetical protein
MLSRRERRFADKQAEKMLAVLKRKNKELLDKQPKILKPIEVTDNMLEELKQYQNERMRMQKTTGDSEPTTNSGTKGEVDNYFDNLDDYHFNK